MWSLILDRCKDGNPILPSLKDRPGAIAAAVVSHNDFMWHLVQAELEMEMLNRRRDTSLFVPRGDDHAQNGKL